MNMAGNPQGGLHLMSTTLAVEQYDAYLSRLLKGDRRGCSQIVDTLFQQGMSVKDIYVHLFQPSLYQIGSLWEANRISVATEHIATSITEVLMNQLFPNMISPKRIEKRAIVISTEGELHQVGSKMVADIIESKGWDALYLGANTPTLELIRFLRETEPDVLAISLTVYFHLASLENMLRRIRVEFPDLTILIGGQAFRYGGESLTASHHEVYYIASLDQLESFLDKRRPV